MVHRGPGVVRAESPWVTNTLWEQRSMAKLRQWSSLGMCSLRFARRCVAYDMEDMI